MIEENEDHPDNPSLVHLGLTITTLLICTNGLPIESIHNSDSATEYADLNMVHFLTPCVH